MRIFVTGASGFIGQQIVPLLLKDKHQLLLLSRSPLPVGLKLPGVKGIVGDLKGIDKIKGAIKRFDPQACLHLAWEGIPDYSYEMSRRNLDQSLDLFHFLANETKCGKIVVSGSCWEDGLSFFSWAKNAVHAFGRVLAAKHQIDLVWLRVFFAYGPGQKKHSLIPTLYDAFKHGKTPDIRNPDHAQDFIYVGDVANAFQRALKDSVAAGEYELKSGKLTKVKEVQRLVKKQMDGWKSRVTIAQGIKKHIAHMERI